jgi:tetratricopeptide (TPR) repeat protein
MEQTVYRRDEQALECFERALSVWPGPAEWSLLHFRAQSLARLGKRDEAEQSRILARKIESKMELSVHQNLRTLLLDLDEPGVLRTMANFYRSLGRDWEAEEWSRLATELPSSR